MALAALSCLLALAALAPGSTVKRAPRCQVFPRDSHWNVRVDGLPVAGDSAALVRSIGLDRPVHPDFGAGLYEGRPIGIPYTTVSRRQRRVRVSFDYADESDRGRYPIPRRAPIEGGRNSDGDRHVIVVDRDRCRLYELFAAYPQAGGRRWRAGSGAVWSLRSNRLRPRGWTSADAAGLPILPGLARYEEVRRGAIDHALRFTAQRTRRAYVYPGPPLRLELRRPGPAADGPARAAARRASTRRASRARPASCCTALKRYGMILADNGSPWYVSGAPSSGWNNDDLHELRRVRGADFEVVDTSSLPRPGE